MLFKLNIQLLPFGAWRVQRTASFFIPSSPRREIAHVSESYIFVSVSFVAVFVFVVAIAII